MATRLFALLFILLYFNSCTLEGVKNQNDDTVSEADSIPNLNKVDSAYIELENNLVQDIQKDTLDNGKINEMVWSNKDGLRIEWKEKKNTISIEKNNVIMVNFEARVALGEVYDSNTQLRKPVPLKLGVGQLIKGWEQALLQMHVGDVGRIMIPSELGYGKAGYLGKVPRNADIIVEIEILQKVAPVILEEGVKVYKYFEADTAFKTPAKNQVVTFDYFAFRKGEKPGLYDNSYAKGNPFSVKFKNDNVVDGLHQGLEVLRQGDKAFIEIPSNLAYGKKGMLDLVPSNTDIVYDIRIESIK